MAWNKSKQQQQPQPAGTKANRHASISRPVTQLITHAPVVESPFQHVQLAPPSGRGASRLVPWACVLSEPLEDIQVAVYRRTRTGRLVPVAAVLPVTVIWFIKHRISRDHYVVVLMLAKVVLWQFSRPW